MPDCNIDNHISRQHFHKNEGGSSINNDSALPPETLGQYLSIYIILKNHKFDIAELLKTRQFAQGMHLHFLTHIKT